jgi:hypothetical protein
MPRRCGQTKAKHTQTTLALRLPFCTAEGHETTTTTPETSLVVTSGPYHARTAYSKPSFYSLAPNAPSVRPNQGKTHAIYTWLSRAHLVLPGAAIYTWLYRAHLVLPGAAKPRQRHRRHRQWSPVAHIMYAPRIQSQVFTP